MKNPGFTPWALALFTVAACVAGDVAVAQQPVTLRTSDSVVQLQAGSTAPRLLSLSGIEGLPWLNTTDDTLIAFATVDGQQRSLKWKFVPSATRVSSQEVSFTYESQMPHLRLTWLWEARAGFGPIEHRIRIENLEARELWIPLQRSLAVRFATASGDSLQSVYVDKGAGRPTSDGTHIARMPVGYEWHGTSSTYAADEAPREVIPWMLVERTTAGNAQNSKQGSGDGWYAGLEFSGRTSLNLERKGDVLIATAGLNPDPAPFLTRLPAGAAFDAPPVFLGAFHGDRDDAGNVLRPWVRTVLTHSETWSNPQYPMLVNNSWGGGMQVDEVLAKRMIADSAELGLEMFHIDAGWFRGVGDWYPDPKKFPHGLAPIADDAHAHGLKFGIWVDWAQAGVSDAPGAASVRKESMRDDLIADTPSDWKPDDFVGRTMDLGVPAVKQYAQNEVERIVSSYKLDMLEHDGYVVAHACARKDHPHAPPPDGYPTEINGNGIKLPLASNSTDVSYHAVRSYYEIYTKLRHDHPELLLEVCNDGGRMVDFGSASHGDYFSITDVYDPLSNRQAFYDASQVLPAAMLEDYVEKWPTPTLENFRYMLRSGMMGWLTIMQDTNAWSPEQHAAAGAEFALYKERLRPLIRDADLYHLSARPDGVHWDAVEYFDPKASRGMVYAFRGTTTDEAEHVFVLRGLRGDRNYRIHFEDGSSPDATLSGQDLLRSGLKVALKSVNSSELIFVEEAGA
jgi:hypothetical protein